MKKLRDEFRTCAVGSLCKNVVVLGERMSRGNIGWFRNRISIIQRVDRWL